MEVFMKVRDLPDEWDSVCGDNYSLKRKFLSLMEEINPCQQKYYIFRDENGNIDSILMTFVREKHNLFMFSPINYYCKVTFVYVPASVTRPGIVSGEKTHTEVEAFLKTIKGYVVILNVPKDIVFSNFGKGLTLPRIVVNVRWNTFDEYLQDMRSNYRYRYNKAIKKARDLKFYQLNDNKMFNEKLYSLYEQIYDNSELRVEKLSIGFFQDNFSKIFVYELDNEPVGFIQLVENGKELVFEFVGVDYKYNNKYDIYINMLLKIIEYGIDNKFEVIDLGQTADDAKLKTGGKYELLYALVRHSNPLTNWVTKKLTHFIEYKPLKEKFNVFKNEE